MTPLIVRILDFFYGIAPLATIKVARGLYFSRLSRRMVTPSMFSWLCAVADCNTCGGFVTDSLVEKSCAMCRDFAQWEEESKRWEEENRRNELIYRLDDAYWRMEEEIMCNEESKRIVAGLSESSFKEWLEEVLPDLDGLQTAYLLERRDAEN